MEAEGSVLSTAGCYHRLADHEELHENKSCTTSADDSRLRQLGYKQELARGLSFIANFSLTFSIVSVLTGISTLYNQALTFGGPITIVYGWPIVGLMTLIVGLALAEICSAYPTSGGLYYWSAKLCGDKFGPFASWITGCPQINVELDQETVNTCRRCRIQDIPFGRFPAHQLGHH